MALALPPSILGGFSKFLNVYTHERSIQAQAPD